MVAAAMVVLPVACIEKSRKVEFFDPQQRAARLGAAMDGHVSVLLRS